MPSKTFNTKMVRLTACMAVGTLLGSVFPIAGPFFASPVVWAQSSSTVPVSAFGLPEDVELYSSRPAILTLTAKAHPELGGEWAALKRGHTELVAMLLEMYPDREIYFLARDGELLYDYAKAATREEPATQKRLHLINVSSTTKDMRHLDDYLAQEGISRETLSAGKKVLFVDTGFNGTIPTAIANRFPLALRSRLQAQLILSTNSVFPSSRVFLTAINPAASRLVPGSLVKALSGYEDIAHYTNRSVQFVNSNGRWEAMSSKNDVVDGIVYKEKAVAYMEDLLQYASEERSRALLAKRRAQWKKLHELSQAPGLTREQLETGLKALLESSHHDPFVEAAVRDFVELKRTNFRDGPRVWISVIDAIGLPREEWGHAVRYSTAAIAIAQHPEWAEVLRNPFKGVPKLVEAGKFDALAAITDVVQDEAFKIALTRALGKRPTEAAKQFVRNLIEKGDRNTLLDLTHYTFSEPGWNSPEDEVLKQALQIANLQQRHEFLETHLPKAQCDLNTVLDVIKSGGGAL